VEKIGVGSFPKICPETDLITFTHERDEQFEVYVMRMDGTDLRCVSCDQPALEQTRHRGQSDWHPSCDYITFTAETAKYPRLGNGTSTRPGIGRNHNVWIMRADASAFWQITDYPENWGAIQPHFSHDGTKIFWNEEFLMEKYPEGKGADEPKWPTDPPSAMGHPGCYWGSENWTWRIGEELCNWRVKTATLSFSGGPVLGNIKTVDPPDGFTLIESNGFLPADNGYVYGYADLSRAPDGRGLLPDIYVSDLEGGNLRQLSNNNWVEEDFYFSPDGRKILHKKARAYPAGQRNGDDLYLMDADGGNVLRVTHLKDPESNQYIPDSQQTTESTWCSDGTCAVFGHVVSAEEVGPDIPSDLLILNFVGSCGNAGGDSD
jgi:Tol biopolymer transport system component